MRGMPPREKEYENLENDFLLNSWVSHFILQEIYKT